MPRPKKCRRIREYPQFLEFAAQRHVTEKEVVLSLDEYETICLVDYRGLTHKECAECMEVSRTTVTEIYDSARKKVADMIVNGKKLVISGGEYRLSRADEGCCYRKYLGHDEDKIHVEDLIEKKEKGIYRIAICNENGRVFNHFGMTESFMIYDIKKGTIIKKNEIETCGVKRGALVGFLEKAQADLLICGGIGSRAAKNIDMIGIKLIQNVSGNIEDLVNKIVIEMNI